MRAVMNMKSIIKRMFRSLRPMRRTLHGRITPCAVARRYGRGNVFIQLGRVTFEDGYRAIRERVEAYEF